jgi:hypothetical protein
VFRVPDTLPPNKPVITSVTALTGALVRIIWQLPLDPGGSGIENQEVLRDGQHLAWTGQATPTALAVSVNSTEWSYASIAGQPAQPLPAPAIATASGGVGPYSYLWERTPGMPVSLQDTQTSVQSPTSASTRWSRTLPTQSAEYVSTWRCRVTDNAGTVVYTPNVTVTFVRENLD